MKVGYIGLGALGGELARRFIGTHELCVWDLNAAATAAFEKSGARVAPSAAALARECEVVLVCLPRSSDVQQLIFGANGLAEGLSPGKLVIDQTSGIPRETRDMARQLALRGVGMIDAAVSASPQIVASGGATLMVAGPDDLYEMALPVLHAITHNIHRCGTRVGDGQAMKIVNNAMNAGCRLGTLEIVAMGRKAGLTLECMTDVLNKGGGRNLTTEVMLPNISRGKVSTNFALSLQIKDLNQALTLGMEGGVPMPLTSIVRGLMQIGANTLGPQARLEDMIGVVETMAGTRLAQPAEAVDPQGSKAGLRDAAALKVGYVGLGAMGGPLARRLMLTRQLRVHDAREDLVRQFEAQGAIAAADLASLARECDVILMCLPTSAIVQQVIFGPAGLAEGLSAGKIVIDQTSGDPEQTRRMATELGARGVTMIDAPVSGGPRGAAAGTIAIMLAGSFEAKAQVRPILESISPNIVDCGDVGNGHVVKIVNNAVSSLGRLVSYECLIAGYKYGLKVHDMNAVLPTCSGRSVPLQKVLATLVTGQGTADFQLQLMVKDLRLGAGLGISVGAPMMVSNGVRALFEAGLNKFGPTANIEEMLHLYEDMASTKFEPVSAAATA